MTKDEEICKLKDEVKRLERENAMLEHSNYERIIAEKCRRLLDNFVNDVFLLFYTEFDELLLSIMEDKICQVVNFYKQKL